MSVEQLLAELRAQDIRLFVDGGRLRCSAPKGRLTADLERRIAGHKSELLRVLQPSTSLGLTTRRRSGPLPLSFAQERFWFLQSLDPESTAYNITAHRRLFGPVDECLLVNALRASMHRHEVLRANFPEVDGAPSQVIRKETSPALSTHDLAPIAETERQAAADALIQQQATQPFDLARDPLLRVALLRFSAQESVLVLTMHHIICDGWSIGILFNELASFYEAYWRGGAVEIPEFPVQFSDYAQWERERQTTEAIAPQLEYWKQKLAGAPPFLDFPVDKPRPTAPGSEGRLQRFELDAVTTESIKLLARQQGATLFMALLAVFKAILARYSKQNDILVGTPVSTRTQPELEPLIGCFINTQVMRTQFSAETTAKELLAAVRTTVLESVHHADVPFELLVNEFVTERDLSRTPLFQVAFILQNTPMASEYSVVSGGTAFDMTLYMWEARGCIGGSIEYSVDLFHPETIAHFAECFGTMASEMAAQPDTPLSRLPLIPAARQAEWLDRHQGATLSFPRDLCTHAWIEQRVQETPEATAVVCGDERLTYRQVSLRSNRLAHRLRGMGVGPDSLVALCLERSTDLVVATLAVWKAGGAYVPLDPEYPSHRLAFMLEDSGAGVLVSQNRLLSRLPRELPAVICLDRDRQQIERESPDAPSSIVNTDNLAYVIYTSGSTGKPKGVEISHRALVNFLSSMQREPGMGASDRLLAVTTLSFDIAGLELYLPLVSGARVVIAPRTAVFDGAALAELIRESKITVMQATPVTWQLMLESGWKGAPGLKILCGGEALPRELADRLLATGGEVWNLYGPTETTIWSTLARVAEGTGRVSIGRPIANTQVHILDEFGAPVPPGVSGELCIGGDGLARGYLHRPELTAERFASFPQFAGKRLYRTGDLARRLTDGSLDCLARLDHQVKLRGYRIELGEIETALERQPGIAQAAVVVRNAEGGAELTAYLRSQDPAGADTDTLRKSLQNVLPKYMVPSEFVFLEQLPLTPNRKVDRKALQGPEYSPQRFAASAGAEGGKPNATAGADAGVGPGQPDTQVELTMSEIWRDVLNINHVGLNDNFFDLGGHSLSATRVVARLRSALNMELPLRCIFLDPTIAALSKHIYYDATAHGYRYSTEVARWSCLVPAQPKGTRTPLFFVGGYQSPDDTLLVLSQLIPHLGQDQPVFGFRPRWIEGNGESYSSVKELASEFASELRTVQPHGPYLLGGHCVGGIAAMEVAQLLREEGEEVKLLVCVDTERPTPMRTLRTDVFFMKRKATHMKQVLGELRKGNNRERVKIVRDLLQRKLKIAAGKPANEADRFYQLKVRYRRLLYSHTPGVYPGRVTLIINEDQARLDKDFGWAGGASGGLDIHTIPGNHDHTFRYHGKEVAQVILESIDKALAQPASQAERAAVNAS